MKIFVTGGTGFIGSHLVRSLKANGHEVVALRREKSSLARCEDFEQLVAWVNQDVPDWTQSVIAARPGVIIHAAWAGVTAAGRADWKLQAANLALFCRPTADRRQRRPQTLYCPGFTGRIYGPINGRVNEACPCLPDTAYGATKLAALALLEGFAHQKKMAYAWLRLFSVYGPGEGESWFIPSLIRQMKLGHSPQLSGCEQRYDYLHVHDLASGLRAVLQRPEKSGVFNLSSNTSLPLKQVVQLVKEYTAAARSRSLARCRIVRGSPCTSKATARSFNQVFAFQPKISMVEGLGRLVEESAAAK